MKITHRKSGVSIRCSNSDFAALQALVAAGEASDPRKRFLSGNAKSAYTRRTKDGPLLRADVDKRGS